MFTTLSMFTIHFRIFLSLKTEALCSLSNGGGALVSELYLTLVTPPWTVAHQAPLSMGFPRQEYWSELPFHSLGDLPDPGIEPVSSLL